MGHPGLHARTRPDHPAIVMAGSGQTLSYRQLDERSNRLAHLFRASGLTAGDHVAVFMENQIRFMEVVWAGLRSGIHVTAINSYLAPDELSYIVDDCDARLVISSRAKSEVAGAIDTATTPKVERWLMTDGLPAGDGGPTWQSFETEVAAFPATPIVDQRPGGVMLYSSGTTGRPKGIVRPLPEHDIDELDSRTAGFAERYRFGPDMVYLSPAPMYHAAPLAASIAVHRIGGTLVMMERFDAVRCLADIERHRATHGQFVPTMFVRMLKLPREERGRHDLSSMEVAIHGAGPCPVEVKRQMIDWWGPILYEYYAGTEGNGATMITSEEWLERPGSVGRPRSGQVHICDQDGNDLPAGEIGSIYFSGAGTYEYHNAPEKTAEASLPGGRTTLGDIGYLDDGGYLYLTDRRAHTIISGGVNIYPREIEDVLVIHPRVADLAVFGVPDSEMGEQVKAVVQPADDGDNGGSGGEVIGHPEREAALEAELIAFARDRIAHYKCPKSIDFLAELPRLPTGKLAKRLLREHYWGDTGSKTM